MNNKQALRRCCASVPETLLSKSPQHPSCACQGHVHPSVDPPSATVRSAMTGDVTSRAQGGTSIVAEESILVAGGCGRCCGGQAWIVASLTAR